MFDINQIKGAYIQQLDIRPYRYDWLGIMKHVLKINVVVMRMFRSEVLCQT